MTQTDFQRKRERFYASALTGLLAGNTIPFPGYCSEDFDKWVGDVVDTADSLAEKFATWSITADEDDEPQNPAPDATFRAALEAEQERMFSEAEKVALKTLEDPRVPFHVQAEAAKIVLARFLRDADVPPPDEEVSDEEVQRIAELLRQMRESAGFGKSAIRADDVDPSKVMK